MDNGRFGLKAPGRLVRISNPTLKQPGPGNDWAFVPDELPLQWQFDESIWRLIVEARAALGTLNGIGRIIPNASLLLQPLQNQEAISSSSIEGTHVTPNQLLLFGLDPQEPKSNEDAIADPHEVFNYGRALAKGRELLQKLPLCGRLTRLIHAELMQGVRAQQTRPGEFRQCQVQIGKSGRFIPPPAAEVDRLMANLETYLNASDLPYDPLIQAFVAHYQFEAIHPFLDGNGRVGRVLLALMIFRALDHSQPWFYLSPYFEHFKEEYVQNLFGVSTQGRWEEWFKFCLRGTIAQAHDSIRRCEAFIRLSTQYHQQVVSPTARTHPLIDFLFASPIVTVTAVRTKFQITYSTAKADLDKLAESGLLSLRDIPRKRMYVADEIMKIAYSPPDFAIQSFLPTADEG